MALALGRRKWEARRQTGTLAARVAGQSVSSFGCGVVSFVVFVSSVATLDSVTVISARLVPVKVWVVGLWLRIPSEDLTCRY